MEKLVEPKVVTTTTTSTNSLNPKMIAKIKTYMQRELFTEAKPEVVGKKQSTQATDAHLLSIFDGSIYVEPKGRSYYTTSEKLLSIHVSEFFKRGKACRQAGEVLDKKVCVILGDPGSGKTTFGKHYMKEAFKRWTKNPNQHPIPLWIPLSRLKMDYEKSNNDIYKGLLTYLFQKRIELSLKQIDLIKTQPLHIFLDSYDEINYMDNLYDTNKWAQWPQTQFVVATRPEKFRSEPNTLNECLVKYFSPAGSNQEEINVYTISPLDDKLIQQFIAQWVKLSKNIPSDWDDKHYWKAIEATPNIKLLAVNPVMLTMLMHTLPQLDKEYANKNKVERFRLEQLAIYNKFVDIWFGQQTKRIEQQLNDYPTLHKNFRKAINQKGFSIQSCLRTYTENLAYRCLLDSPDEKLVIEIKAEKTLLPQLLSHVPGAQQFLKTLSNQKADDGESYVTLWMKLLRSGCLLRCDANYFAFFHKSLVEYFTQQHLFNDVCMDTALLSLKKAAYDAAKAEGKESAQSAAINGKLFVKEHNLVSMLAKQAQNNTTFRDKLYELVSRSCQDEQFSTAAANAITILNNAHQPLNHPERNWRGLRITEADLSYAILECVQWQGGDLRGVNFYGAYLKEANFSDARLLNCQWPIPDKLAAMTFLKFPMPVTTVVYTWDGNLLIAGDVRGKIGFYSTVTYECVKTINQYAWHNVSFNYPVSALAVDGGIKNQKSTMLASAASGDGLFFFGLSKAEIYLWKLPSGKYQGKLLGHKKGIDDLQFTNDGKILLSHGTDGTTFIWNTQTLKLIQQIKAPNKYFSTINFKLISSKPDTILPQTIYLKAKPIDKNNPKKDRFCKCYFQGPHGHDHKTSFMMSYKQFQFLNASLDTANKEKEVIIQRIGYKDYVSPGVALSPTGQYIVHVQSDGQLFFYGLEGKTSCFRQATPVKVAKYITRVQYLRFSPDERYLAACGSNGNIVLWSIETGEEPAVLTCSSTDVTQFRFSVTGKYLAAMSSNKIEWINMQHHTFHTIYEGDNDIGWQSFALAMDSSQVALANFGVELCPIYNTTSSKNTFEYRVSPQGGTAIVRTDF